MKAFFLLNPSHQKKQWDYREKAGQIARRCGWTPRFGQVERDRPQSCERLLQQALEEGCSRVVVIGGDGTLHRVINALHRQKRLRSTELALVPAGTCNDFARALGLSSRNTDEAFRVACTDPPRETDLGEMQGELFLNNAGFGRHPSNAVEPARAKGARRARPLKTLRSFTPLPLRAEWEKGSVEGVFFMGMACNAPFFSKGLYFSKNPRVNDGFLDFFLLPTMPKWKLLPLLFMGKLGRPVRSRHMITLRVQRLLIEAQSDLWPQADGEPPVKATRKVVFSISPEKANIIAPSKGRTLSLYG